MKRKVEYRPPKLKSGDAPYYKHRGVEYKPHVESDTSSNHFKIWHEMYMIGTGQFMGAFNYNQYSFAPREDFEKAVDLILDRGR